MFKQNVLEITSLKKVTEDTTTRCTSLVDEVIKGFEHSEEHQFDPINSVEDMEEGEIPYFNISKHESSNDGAKENLTPVTNMNEVVMTASGGGDGSGSSDGNGSDSSCEDDNEDDNGISSSPSSSPRSRRYEDEGEE